MGYGREVNTFVFHDSIGYAQHHIRVICPIANFPSSAMTVLKNIAIVGYAIGLFPSHVFICHAFSAKSERVSYGLTIYGSF